MPSYEVTGRIVRDGKEYLPGDRIELSRDEAQKLILSRAFCIKITDPKELKYLRDTLAEVKESSRESSLRARGRKLGVSAESIDELLEQE